LIEVKLETLQYKSFGFGGQTDSTVATAY